MTNRSTTRPRDGDGTETTWDVVLVERENVPAVQSYLKRIRDATSGDRTGSNGGA